MPHGGRGGPAARPAPSPSAGPTSPAPGCAAGMLSPAAHRVLTSAPRRSSRATADASPASAARSRCLASCARCHSPSSAAADEGDVGREPLAALIAGAAARVCTSASARLFGRQLGCVWWSDARGVRPQACGMHCGAFSNSRGTPHCHQLWPRFAAWAAAQQSTRALRTWRAGRVHTTPRWDSGIYSRRARRTYTCNRPAVQPRPKFDLCVFRKQLPCF